MGLEEISTDSILMFESITKKRGGYTDFIAFYRIFSFAQNWKSTILSRRDEFSGNYLTTGETKEVTIGSYHAMETFRAYVPFWSSFALGLDVSLFDTKLIKRGATDSNLTAIKEPGFVQSRPSLFPFFVPRVLFLSWAFPTFKWGNRRIIHKQYLCNENYYRGYHGITKQKTMLGALLGSLYGIVSGMILYYSLQ